MKANEFQLRDNTGRELAVYNMNTGRVKYLQPIGNGALGRAEANGIQSGLRIRNLRTPGTGLIQEQIQGITILRIILEASEYQ